MARVGHQGKEEKASGTEHEYTQVLFCKARICKIFAEKGRERNGKEILFMQRKYRRFPCSDNRSKKI